MKLFNIHDKIDRAKFLSTSISSPFQALELANIHSANPNHLGPGADCCHLERSALGFLYIAANDASIGAQVNQGAHLGTTNGACAACAKDDLVRFIAYVSDGASPSDLMVVLPNMPSFQTSLIYSDFEGAMIT